MNPFIRTSVFGKDVHLDLKYRHEVHARHLHVALSMVDGGTFFHAAYLLPNQKADCVAKKFLRHWCSLYGTPTTVYTDQGVRFDGTFVGGNIASPNLMEDYWATHAIICQYKAKRTIRDEGNPGSY